MIDVPEARLKKVGMENVQGTVERLVEVSRIVKGGS